MSAVLKRKIANLFDRPGGRRLLSMAATHWAHSITGDHDLSIIYDDMWIDVINQTYIPRSSTFKYVTSDFQYLRNLASDRLSASLDYWTHVYRPQPGDTVIDVGAGIGIDTLALSPLVGSTGRIYSIEAHPWRRGKGQWNTGTRCTECSDAKRQWHSNSNCFNRPKPYWELHS